MAKPLHIADFSVERIIEQEGPLRPAKEFLIGLTDELLEENRSWLMPDALDAAGNVCLCFQSFLVRTPHHTILVDSCMGNDKNRPNRPMWHMKTDTRFMDGLAACGLGVEQIDYVLCTHMHVDHVGWNTRLQDGRWVPTFPNARYIFSQTEYDYWQIENAKAENPVFADSVLPVIEAGRAELVGDTHGIGDHVRLVPTPGHTPGHVAASLGRGREEAIISGDVLHSPLQARYPELSVVVDYDPAQAGTTRRAFLERCVESDTICCMSHFPSPSIGHVKRWGEGFRCEVLPA